MRFEEQYEETLKDIETAVVLLYRKNPTMTDHVVGRAYEAAMFHYRAITRNQTPKPHGLNGIDLTAFDTVMNACKEWEAGAGGRKQLKPEEILECVKVLQRSVERWSKNGGRKGYLDFVNRYIK